MGGFSVDCGFNGVRNGLVRLSMKESSSVPVEFCGEFDVWIYGIEVLLMFVDLIIPIGTVDIINIPGPQFD